MTGVTPVTVQMPVSTQKLISSLAIARLISIAFRTHTVSHPSQMYSGENFLLNIGPQLFLG